MKSSIETAKSLVLGQRNADYGTPKQDFDRTAMVWSGIIGLKLREPLTCNEVALMMVGLKLVREAHKPKDDNVDDAHGYLLCLEWIKTGVMPDGTQLDDLRAKIAELQQCVEDVACGMRLTCSSCGKLKPCNCDHTVAQSQ